jgi:hypothetical protein
MHWKGINLWMQSFVALKKALIDPPGGPGSCVALTALFKLNTLEDEITLPVQQAAV